MAKKLLGERQIGDIVYLKDSVITNEQFAASGLAATDVADVAEGAAPVAAAQETVAAKTDTDAEVDSQAGGAASTDDASKQDEQQSTQTGSEAAASDAGSASGAASTEGAETVETVDHTLTEQDLIDNPELATQGYKVGDVVKVPKEDEATV